jgi:hypothetical protein
MNERSDLDDDPGDQGNEESTGILAEDIVDAEGRDSVIMGDARN